MRRASLVLAALTGTWAGCSTSSDFVCSEDTQCQTGEAFGTCQANGYCSFDEPSCPSGQRYGDNSGPFSGMCVELDPGTGTSGEGSSGPTTAPPSTSTTMPPGDTTVAVGDTDTMSTTDVTTATDDPSTTSGSSGGDESSSGSSGGERGCVPVLEDDFEDGVLDPAWTVVPGGGVTVEESGGHLAFVLAPLQTGYASVNQLFGVLEGHRFWVEIATLQPPSASATLDCCVVTEDDLDEFCFYSDEDFHYAATVVGPIEDDVGAEPVDPLTSRFIGIAFAGGNVTWEVSGDGETWTEVHTQPHNLMPGTNVYVQIGGGRYAAALLSPDDEVAAEAMGVCQL